MLENTLGERRTKEEKIARDIKNAKVKFNAYVLCLLIESFDQDNWQPALETLVASIGAKFSAAFDREHLVHLHLP